MIKIARNCYSSDSINVRQLILLIYCLYTRVKNIIFSSCAVLFFGLSRISVLTGNFSLHFLLGFSLGSREETYFFIWQIYCLY